MQTITLRETNEVFSIQDMVYPFLETGILYLRMVVVDGDNTPTQFIVARPQDILYRAMSYDQEVMNEIVEESEKAIQSHMEMMESGTTEETTVDDSNYHG